MQSVIINIKNPRPESIKFSDLQIGELFAFTNDDYKHTGNILIKVTDTHAIYVSTSDALNKFTHGMFDTTQEDTDETVIRVRLLNVEVEHIYTK